MKTEIGGTDGDGNPEFVEEDEKGNLQGPFLDELDVMNPEIEFWNSLSNPEKPRRLESLPHKKYGSTTIIRQGTKIVGISVRFRDENNFSLLATMDFRKG